MPDPCPDLAKNQLIKGGTCSRRRSYQEFPLRKATEIKKSETISYLLALYHDEAVLYLIWAGQSNMQMVESCQQMIMIAGNSGCTHGIVLPDPSQDFRVAHNAQRQI